MRNSRSRGFTLLEVVIAMMIMAFLSLFTVQSIQQALKTKSKVQKEIDKNSTLRDALRIMERDINMAFNYRDPSIELFKQAQLARRKKAINPGTAGAAGGAGGTGGGTGGTGGGTGAAGGSGSGTGAAGGAAPASLTPAQAAEKYPYKEEKIYTHFVGNPADLDFTTVSNIRMTEDSKVSSQAEIGYHLKSCRRRSTQEQSTQCLWRRVSNYIHDDITKPNGEETVLLENVTEFKLRYLGPGKEEEWIDTWISTDNGSDAITKGKFPYAVEVTLAVRDTETKDKNLRMTIVAAVRNPNNKKAEATPGSVPTDGSAGVSGSGTGGASGAAGGTGSGLGDDGG